MKKFILFWILVLGAFPVWAHHIIGGVMWYQDEGSDGAGGHKYFIHLRLYRGCEPPDSQHAALDPQITFTIYDNGTSQLFGQPVVVPLGSIQVADSQYRDPCILNPPAVCYQIGHYDAEIDLPVNAAGYTVAFQRCCRNNLLVNVSAADVGATYYTVIPGTNTGAVGDNAPYFARDEAILICANSKFSYNYAAIDPDLDSLSYSFTAATQGGDALNGAPVVAAPPPYPQLAYLFPYSPMDPMGSTVTLDPRTGIISGTAPPAGTYVIGVMVSEYRNNKLIGQTYKDFHIDVTNCHRLVTASLPNLFAKCQSMTINFTNASTPGRSYLWDFGDGDTSSSFAPVHTYADTGSYTVQLKVDPSSNCGDSATTLAKVYPVLHPAFGVTGNCTTRPSLFTDLSTDTSGPVNSWHWDFGNGDSSALANPSYQYTLPNTYQVVLSVGTAKGCLAQDTQQLAIYRTPPIQLTPDTDLCIRDSIHLQAQTLNPGTYNWTPNYHILQANTADPLFFPRVDTTYYVSFTDPTGCSNTDSVHITIKSVLALKAGTDTTICSGDPVSLYASADGNYVFRWFDPAGNPVAFQEDTSLVPPGPAEYTIEAILQSCTARDSMMVRTVPRPAAQPLQAYAICFGTSVNLHASGGTYYSWSPAATLNNPGSANPLASPLDTTLYIASVTDTLGCPKPSFDTSLVAVIPPVRAFAGNDTIIARGQSFQLHASGGSNYLWSPSTGLSDPLSADPLVNGNTDITYTLTAFTPLGCFGTDSIRVRYITGPQIYVPSAFTPNGDGVNDIFRPIPVGITQIDYFRVYDRWGRMVYQTRGYMQGWDGNFRGQPMDAGTFVWQVAGRDFLGKEIYRKGTVVLIR